MIKNYINEFNQGIKTMLKEFFNKETNKKQRANMWTFSRLVLSFIIPIFTSIFVILGSKEFLLLAFITTSFGALTDFFDGRSARKYNSTSEFGKRLDQASDKIFSLMIGLSLSLINPIFLVPIIGEVTIASVNAYYKSKNKNLDIKSSKVGKIKQWPLSISFILGLISILKPQIISLLYTLITVTSIMQIMTIKGYIKTNKEALKKLEEDEKQKYLKKEDKKENSYQKEYTMVYHYSKINKPKTLVKKR